MRRRDDDHYPPGELVDDPEADGAWIEDASLDEDDDDDARRRCTACDGDGVAAVVDDAPDRERSTRYLTTCLRCRGRGVVEET